MTYRTSPGCRFKIRANYDAAHGYAKVTNCFDVHDCSSQIGDAASQRTKRAETAKLAFLLENVPKLIDINTDTSTRAIIEAVKQKYGQELAIRQAQKVKARLILRLKSPSRISSNTSPNRPEPVVVREAIAATNVHSDATQPVNCTEGHSMRAQGVHESVPTFTSPATIESSTAASAHALPAISVAFGHNMDDQPARTIQGTSQRSPVSRHEQRPSSSTTHTAQSGHTGTSGNVRLDHSRAPVLPLSTTSSPQEVRMEAARLMQNAARLMQEAARLNAEAARLTASVANV